MRARERGERVRVHGCGGVVWCVVNAVRVGCMHGGPGQGGEAAHCRVPLAAPKGLRNRAAEVQPPPRQRSSSAMGLQPLKYDRKLSTNNRPSHLDVDGLSQLDAGALPRAADAAVDHRQRPAAAGRLPPALEGVQIAVVAVAFGNVPAAAGFLAFVWRFFGGSGRGGFSLDEFELGGFQDSGAKQGSRRSHLKSLVLVGPGETQLTRTDSAPSPPKTPSTGGRYSAATGFGFFGGFEFRSLFAALFRLFACRLCLLACLGAARKAPSRKPKHSPRKQQQSAAKATPRAPRGPHRSCTANSPPPLTPRRSQTLGRAPGALFGGLVRLVRLVHIWVQGTWCVFGRGTPGAFVWGGHPVRFEF